MARTNAQFADIQSSFIWAQAVPDVFRGAFDGPATVLAVRPRYEQIFDTGGDMPSRVPASFDWPWLYYVGQNFWSNYLGQPALYDVNGRTAWQELVPLRESLRFDVPPSSVTVRGFAEAYYYPHGIGIVLTIRASGLRGTMPSRVDAFRELTQDIDFGVSTDGQEDRGRLPALGPTVLRRLFSTRYGPRAVGSGAGASPFSVTTIIKGTPIDPRQELPADGMLRRALHGLAGWSATWQNDQLGDLPASTIRRSSRPGGHLLYLAERGRVVWFPQHFEETPRKRHSLTCYHRNLTQASLTIESLSALIATGRLELRDPRRWNNLRPDHRECLTNAATRLVELHDGANVTYKTRSAPHQIVSNGARELIDALRSTIGAPPFKSAPDGS